MSPALGEWQGAGDRSMPDMPHCAVEPLFRVGPTLIIRPRRHYGLAEQLLAQRAHLHIDQAELGDPPEDVPAFTNFYPSSEGVWSDAGRSRWKTLLGNG